MEKYKGDAQHNEGLRKSDKSKLIIKGIGIAVGVLFVIFVVLPYAKVELFTAMYDDEFPNVVEDVGWIDELDYIKVMEYSNDKAEVLTVCDAPDMLALCYYEKNGDEWHFAGWDCIWSKYGSANEFIWPFYK